MSGAPNVLLVVLDTARADAFGPYGGKAGSTPAFDQLASRGHATAHTRAAASWTLPSHAAMLLGGLPRDLNLANTPGYRPETARPVVEGHSDRLLASVMRSAGRSTAGVSTNLWVGDVTGLSLGHDEWQFIRGRRQAKLAATDFRSRAAWALQAARARTDDGAEEAAQTIERWLERRRGGEAPFYWFVNLIECHSPYLPPAPFNDLAIPDRIRAASEAREYLTMVAVWKASVGAITVPEAAVERMRRLYAAAIRQLDAWLARILDALERSGVLDDTLVVVTSDHGENFGEDGLMAHAFSLDERLIHVPLAAAGPGAEHLRDLRTLADLPHALCEAAEVRSHPYAASPDGIAIAQFDPPAGRDNERVRRAIEEWGLDERGARRLSDQITVAGRGNLKLQLRGEGPLELFDLAADPLERAPLDPDANPSAELDALRAALESARRPRAPEHDVPAPVAAPAGTEPSSDELARIEEQMRLLGYM